jgi:hypothetical protein
MCLAAFVMLAATAQAVIVAQPATDDIAEIEAISDVEIDFPRGIVIDADLEWDVGDDDVDLELLYAAAGSETETLVFVPHEEALLVQVEVMLDLQSNFVPSGVEIEYRWRLVDDQEVIAESASESTVWFDDRWDWRLLETDQVRVHYYDEAFAAEMLDSAQSTVSELEQRYRLDRGAPLDVWVYASSEDFRSAQEPNSRESVAGASYPGNFLIVAVIPNGNSGEIGRVIPHEVSHQVLYQATENPFTFPPLWFDEGMATHFQIGGTGGYLEMAVRAHRDDALFNLSSLDASFPYLPAQATLAYAASWSAVEYIEEKYGDDGIAALIDALATGTPYDEAISTALGVDSATLNDDWKAWIEDQGS